MVEVWQRTISEVRVGKGAQGELKSSHLAPNDPHYEKMGEELDNRMVCRAGSGACFAAGTLVLMSDGSLKRIELVREGDWVLSKDEKTGEVAAKRVTQTFVRQAPSTLVLTLGGERIETTVEHPFYQHGKGFVPAGSLGIGNSIVTRAGPSLALASREVSNASKTVYNFEVEDFHTYFVGKSSVWVHNDCGEVAFGFSKNLKGFKDTAPNAKNYNDFGLDPWTPGFADRIEDLIKDAPAIHFDLSGMAEINTANGVLNGGPHLNPRGSTNWELRTIWDNPAFRSKTTFYRDGKKLTIEEVLQLN